MKRITVFLLALAALFLTTALPAGRSVEGANPGTINQGIQAVCSDVDGSGAGGAADIGKTVLKFGTVSGGVNYRLLYDSRANGPVGSQDLADVAADFGKTNAAGTCPLVDTQVAQATLAIMDPTYSSMALCGGPCGGDTAFLTENPTFLATKGYYRASTDVPGQGVHYLNFTYFDDDLFNPARPEGLVYDDGELYAQLYYVDGYAVNWGSEPPGIENVQIDAFCTPMPPNTACSWAGGNDGWHLHIDICVTNIGTTSAVAAPGVPDDSCPDETDPGCTVVPDCVRWSARLGWMGHFWNHQPNPNPNSLDVTSNGRFSDCYPDGGVWKGFNCPQ